MYRTTVGVCCLGLLSAFVMGCGASATARAGAADAGTARSKAAAPTQALASGEETYGGAKDSNDAALAARSANAAWIGAAAPSGVLPSNVADQPVAVWVDVPKTTDRVHVPSAVTLAIDTSGSMQGQKIEHARAAARSVLGGLKDGDVVALYTFSDEARLRVPPTEITPRTRALVGAVIDELGAVGATNLFDGVRMAEATTQSAPGDHRVRRVIVISDGRATVGPSDPRQLGELAQAGMGHGVQVTSFGIGLDYDELTLNELALRSSGRLYHLADPTELPGIVKREIALIESTMATDAFVDIVPAPGVTITGIDGQPAGWTTGGGRRVSLGSLFGGQSRELVVRVNVSGERSGDRPLLSARLEYADPSDGGVARVQETLARATFSDDSALAGTRPNPRAQSIISMQDAARIASEASARANEGELGAAEQRLEAAEKKLRDGARTASAPERARILASADRIAGTRRAFSAAKSAPAAHRAAIGRAGALDANDAAMDLQGY